MVSSEAFIPAAPQPESATPQYLGSKGGYFWLVLGNALKIVLTLGIYRFWARTRERRFHWASIRIDGDELEYRGTGIEKLLGFLVAVVVLAVYLSVVNLFFALVGLSLFEGNPLAINLTFLAPLPLAYYAQYRARRYVLSRTRWRGIRFGVEPGAWSYMWRAMGHWLLTILTAGLLYPRQVWYLDLFMTSRSRFGTLRMEMEGSWKPMFGRWFAVWVLVVLFVAVAMVEFASPFPSPGELLFPALVFLVPGMVAYLAFAAFSFRHRTSHKRIGGSTALSSGLRTRQLFSIYVGGGLAIGAIFFVIGLVFYLISDSLFAVFGGLFAVKPGEFPYAAVAIVAIAYLIVFMLFSALAQTFWGLPLVRAHVASLKLDDPLSLREARQVARDRVAQAEGFADALDVGAAF